MSIYQSFNVNFNVYIIKLPRIAPPSSNYAWNTCRFTYYFFCYQDVQKHSVHTLVFRSLKRTHDMFLSDQGTLPPRDEKRWVNCNFIWNYFELGWSFHFVTLVFCIDQFLYTINPMHIKRSYTLGLKKKKSMFLVLWFLVPPPQKRVGRSFF